MALEHTHSTTRDFTGHRILTSSMSQLPALPGRMLMPEGQQGYDVTRVIVLVPYEGVRAEPLAYALHMLHIPHETEIVLSQLDAPKGKGRTQRRQLNALVAWFRDLYPSVRGQTLTDVRWPDALRRYASSHDLLVCLAEQRQSADAFRREPLSQALARALSLPVFEVSGAYPPWTSRLMIAVRCLLFELFPFVVVGIFFWFQVQLRSQTSGWVGTAAMGSTVIVEIALIFIWSLFLD